VAILKNLGIQVGIVLVLLLVLWFGSRSSDNGTDYLEFYRFLFLCRVPLLGLLFLLFLAWAPLKWPAMFGGLVRLENRKMAVACLGIVVLMLSVSQTGSIILENADCRFEDIHKKPSGCIPKIFAPLKIFPDWSWFQLLPAIPILGVLVWSNPRHLKKSPAQMLGRAGIAVAAIFIMVGLVSTVLPFIEQKITSLFDQPFTIISSEKHWFGSGYFTNGMLSGGHLRAAAFTSFVLFLYVVGGFILDPRRTGQLFKISRSLFPPISYLICMAIISIWVLAGITFFLDFWRIPVLLVIAIFTFAAYKMIHWDHYFTSFVREPDSPVAEGLGVDSEKLAKPSLEFVSRKELFEQKSHESYVRSMQRRFESVGQQADKDCLVVVTAFGGGILAGAWVVKVLTELYKQFPTLEKSTGLISSVSGGSVGSLFLLDRMIASGEPRMSPQLLEQANQAVRTSALESVAWGLAYPGLLRMLVPGIIYDRKRDHGWALEKGLERQMSHSNLTLGDAARAYREGKCPQVIFNAVCVENGKRFLFSNGVDSQKIRNKDSDRRVRKKEIDRFDFFGQYSDRDLPLVTAARMSATFPYVSPIARIDFAPETEAFHFADGGYFDNFGLFSAVEWIKDQIELPDSTFRKSKRKKILLIKICSEHESPGPSYVKSGWQHTLFGPIQTLLSVRGASQAERVESDLDFLKLWCAESDYATEFHEVTFSYSGAGPLSWELKPFDCQQIDTCWEMDFQTRFETPLTSLGDEDDRDIAVKTLRNLFKREGDKSNTE